MISRLAFLFSSLLASLLVAAAYADDAPNTDPNLSKEQADAEEDGFTPLFNGKDLTGWEGATDGYAAEDGVLVCVKGKGGNLYTEKQYANFVLRFDFMLDKGGNNGVGIRCEKGKDAAYHGMEIQILDDSAPEYAGLQPYQVHGSIYGVVPAERGHLKPAGEWNSEEITADGTHIVVRLNGATIVDADIEKAGKPRTVDGREHPGLFNESGYIGFLGHGHELKFRNIRIKELPSREAAGSR